jgi:hypothetical protein
MPGSPSEVLNTWDLAPNDVATTARREHSASRPSRLFPNLNERINACDTSFGSWRLPA